MDEARRKCIFDYFRRIDTERGKMERSWQEKAVIYEAGGRGYWSEEDLSRVVWTSTVKSLPPPANPSQDLPSKGRKARKERRLRVRARR